MSSNPPLHNVEYQQHSPTKSDYRTKFHPNEAPDGHRTGGTCELFYWWYARLRKRHKGLDGWSDQREVTRETNYYLIDAVSSQLDLNTRQKKIATSYMNRVDCQRYSNVGGVEIVAFCLCQIACKEDSNCQNRYYHPQANPDKNDRLFRKLFIDFGFDPQRTANAIQKLRHELGL